MPHERPVFIADDSGVARGAIKRRVVAAGFLVIEGASAVLDASVDATSLACALLDLDLGDGDGTEVAATLRGVSPSLPIAFFSAGAAREILERARALGPVFAKPAELDEAVEWIEQNARGEASDS